MIRTIQNDNYVKKIKSDFDDIIIIDRTTGAVDTSKYKDKLIIIDNWDFLCVMDENFANRVCNDVHNRFLIFGRKADKLYISLHQSADLVRNGNTLSLEYWT